MLRGFYISYKVLTRIITPIYCLDKMILIYISLKIIPSLIHAIHISRHLYILRQQFYTFVWQLLC